MDTSIIRSAFWRRGDVGCVAVVPDVSLVGKVVETDGCEEYCESDDSPSADCWHLVVFVGFVRE